MIITYVHDIDHEYNHHNDQKHYKEFSLCQTLSSTMAGVNLVPHMRPADMGWASIRKGLKWKCSRIPFISMPKRNLSNIKKVSPKFPKETPYCSLTHWYYLSWYRAPLGRKFKYILIWEAQETLQPGGAGGQERPVTGKRRSRRWEQEEGGAGGGNT